VVVVVVQFVQFCGGGCCGVVMLCGNIELKCCSGGCGCRGRTGIGDVRLLSVR
jgi:hypothetical protein